LGYHKKDKTTQKSIGKAKFTSTKKNLLLQPIKSLESRHKRGKVHWGFIANAMLPPPWMGRF
jgi:hypothetical protein